VASDIVRATHSLNVADVESAYRDGMFPMGEPGSRIVTWHRPKRRAVLPLDAFHISRSLAYVLKQHRYEVTFDSAFAGVMDACADREDPTWISAEFRTVYGELHTRGKAHSVEVWVKGVLAGGLYGVQLGGAFFAESKFHRYTNMSKVALAELVFRLRERGFALLEVQYLTPHLAQFGVVEIPDREYQQRLKTALALPCSFD
jgi:leucyl/phenylalanyl-tRNA--protein transferase